MESANKSRITVKTTVNAGIDKVWKYWNQPEHITKWCVGSPDWHTPRAENDLREGGKFNTRMEAKDGSFGFDFAGVYDQVKTNELISYAMEDGRKVEITFKANGNSTEVIESFDPESENSHEMQQSGWQGILDNFKKYTEQN